MLGTPAGFEVKKIQKNDSEYLVFSSARGDIGFFPFLSDSKDTCNYAQRGRQISEGGTCSVYFVEQLFVPVTKDLYRKKRVTPNYVVKVIDNIKQRGNSAFEAKVLNEANLTYLMKRMHVKRATFMLDETRNRYKCAMLVLSNIGSHTLSSVINMKVELPMDPLVKMMRLIRDLSSIHAQGIIHRDIKPENIIVNGDQLHFFDFGYSQRDSAKTNARIAGTLLFMAPEQLVNFGISRASDYWGLCCTFLAILHLKYPFSNGVDEYSFEDDNFDVLLNNIDSISKLKKGCFYLPKDLDFLPLEESQKNELTNILNGLLSSNVIDREKTFRGALDTLEKIYFSCYLKKYPAHTSEITLAHQAAIYFRKKLTDLLRLESKVTIWDLVAIACEMKTIFCNSTFLKNEHALSYFKTLLNIQAFKDCNSELSMRVEIVSIIFNLKLVADRVEQIDKKLVALTTLLSSNELISNLQMQVKLHDLLRKYQILKKLYAKRDTTIDDLNDFAAKCWEKFNENEEEYEALMKEIGQLHSSDNNNAGVSLTAPMRNLSAPNQNTYGSNDLLFFQRDNNPTLTPQVIVPAPEGPSLS